MGVQEWTQLGAAALSGSAVPWAIKTLWRLLSNSSQREISRLGSLEHLVDALRRALDKGRLREDALAQVLGVLIFGLRQIEELSPVLTDAIERAIEILETAQTQLQRISRGASE